MDLRKYWTACRLHDWLHMMSDDPEVYRAGRDNLERLREIAALSPEHAEMFEAWQHHAFDAGPKPKEPKMED